MSFHLYYGPSRDAQYLEWVLEPYQKPPFPRVSTEKAFTSQKLVVDRDGGQRLQGAQLFSLAGSAYVDKDDISSSSTRVMAYEGKLLESTMKSFTLTVSEYAVKWDVPISKKDAKMLRDFYSCFPNDCPPFDFAPSLHPFSEWTISVDFSVKPAIFKISFYGSSFKTVYPAEIRHKLDGIPLAWFPRSFCRLFEEMGIPRAEGFAFLMSSPEGPSHLVLAEADGTLYQQAKREKCCLYDGETIEEVLGLSKAILDKKDSIRAVRLENTRRLAEKFPEDVVLDILSAQSYDKAQLCLRRCVDEGNYRDVLKC